jgi:putative PIN family toxin of toxin-antitoxin system
MPHAVFDSTTLVSAFLTKNGVSAQLLNQAVVGVFDLYLSDGIIEETRAVLLNREHLRQNFTYTNQDVEEYSVLLRTFARQVTNFPDVKICRDPNDDMVIACALASGASYLVTRDKDLLTLKVHQGVQMVRPEEFIHVLRKRKKEQS